MDIKGEKNSSVAYETNVECILCLEPQVREFLDLGSTSLANGYLAKEELDVIEPTYPLVVGLCDGCGHVQLIEKVKPAEMFTHYLYVSSASDTLKAHLYELSDVVAERFNLDSDDLVIDIGCNDGTLLSGFMRHSVRVLGVDPAENLAELAKNSGADRFVGFFGSDTAEHIVETWGQATAITATNTFPHIPDLHDFVTGVLKALKPGGVLVLEVHYLRDLLDQGAFDTIYHEHVSYWALQPMKNLFELFGMEITDAERLPLHHGQLRVFVQRKGEGTVLPAVQEILNNEKAHNVAEFPTYKRFADTARRIKQELGQTLKDLTEQGKTVVGYGAPAKASTLLKFLGIDQNTVRYIVDRSPLKQGRFTPGLHVPIVHPERLLEDQPDYALLFSWNFVDEIIEQQAEYRSRGGKFILPVPEVKII